METPCPDPDLKAFPEGAFGSGRFSDGRVSARGGVKFCRGNSFEPGIVQRRKSRD